MFFVFYFMTQFAFFFAQCIPQIVICLVCFIQFLFFFFFVLQHEFYQSCFSYCQVYQLLSAIFSMRSASIEMHCFQPGSVRSFNWLLLNSVPVSSALILLCWRGKLQVEFIVTCMWLHCIPASATCIILLQLPAVYLPVLQLQLNLSSSSIAAAVPS